ncbi:hypothetical protein ACIQ1D_19150 [Lysinibacillus xylanilyticus]|uniref:hypothetical protein n=1 Tax=Lysinibacillus xylanilyticus TaxID=582475 RepID=UPI003818887E
MYKQKEDIVFDGSPTKKDLTKAINEMFKNRWTRSYSYLKSKPIQAKNIDIKNALPYVKNNPKLGDFLLYVTTLAIEIDSVQSDIPLDIYNEVNYWNFEKGGYCMYMSVLLYGLLTRNNVVDASNLSYYQGFYDFDIPNDERFAIARIVFNERQMGVHAWLTLKDSLIDLTASQNKTVFDFEFSEAPIILGKFPNGYNLFGFKENQETIEWYWKLFAEHRGMTVDEWFTMHERACAEVINL